MAGYRSNRKTTPGVKRGAVKKKNRHAPTRRNSLGVGMEKPRAGFKHVTRKEDIWRFIRIIPNWKRVSSDLDLIYLEAGDYENVDGWYEYPQRPTIALCAWPEDLKETYALDHYHQHSDLFQRLGLEITLNAYAATVEFTDESARAFQLLHILLHELGHHEYRITEGRGKSGGPESYAEAYANKMEKRLWRSYCEAFKFTPGECRISHA